MSAGERDAVTRTEGLLVTGGTGAIGSHVGRELARRGMAPVLVDVRPPGRNCDDFASQVTFLQTDIRDAESLIRILAASHVTTIIHLAAIPGGPADDDLERTWEINVNGTFNVFRAARIAGVRRVLYASTRAVLPPLAGTRYGHPTYDPVPEDLPPAPRQPYSVSKFVCEQLASQYAEVYRMQAVGMRFSWMFSAEKVAEWHGQRRLDTLQAMGPHRIALVLLAAFSRVPLHLRSGGDLPIDIAYTGRIAESIVALALASHLRHSTYNIGSGQLLRVRDFVAQVAATFPGCSLSVGDGCDFAAGEACLLDMSRFRADVGVHPSMALADDLRACYRLYQRLVDEAPNR